jgi:hypothetical protein
VVTTQATFEVHQAVGTFEAIESRLRLSAPKIAALDHIKARPRLDSIHAATHTTVAA